MTFGFENILADAESLSVEQDILAFGLSLSGFFIIFWLEDLFFRKIWGEDYLVGTVNHPILEMVVSSLGVSLLIGSLFCGQAAVASLPVLFLIFYLED